MRIIEADNVNEAYVVGLRMLRQFGVKESSRAGDVLVMPMPVTTVYRNPTERVLFNPTRDANPFFHLMEALWMLAGRNDATWLDLFVKDFSSRFAEEDGFQHGAYGYRWREHFDLEGGGCPNLPDQLQTVVQMLQANPDDRRVVLQMWDPVADLGAAKRDVPCNIALLPRVRNEGSGTAIKKVLDVTVFCRSNDAIWGAYGANAVHFSVLQEYLAARVGVCVGRYYQISNNFHAYVPALEKVGTPQIEGSPYRLGGVRCTSIVTIPEAFDDDLRTFFATEANLSPYRNEFFTNIAVPMLTAARCWRKGNVVEAEKALCDMPAWSDWRVACMAWLGRRRK